LNLKKKLKNALYKEIAFFWRFDKVAILNVRMDGAWLGSIDIAIKKARTARFFDDMNTFANMFDM
jgi:hypothetical protein